MDLELVCSVRNKSVVLHCLMVSQVQVSYSICIIYYKDSVLHKISFFVVCRQIPTFSAGWSNIDCGWSKVYYEVVQY